jgi:hypothetical protein
MQAMMRQLREPRQDGRRPGSQETNMTTRAVVGALAAMHVFLSEYSPTYVDVASASTNASSTTPRRAADCGHRVNTSSGMAAAIAW